jgi:hypothetical protein
VRATYATTALLFGLVVLSGSRASAEDNRTDCMDMINALRIKAGSDYDAAAGKLRAKGWHQTFTTTQNIALWTKGGHTVTVTLNPGNGMSTTTTGAVRCRH